MTKLQAIRWFVSFVTEDKVVIARDKFPCNNYAIDIINAIPRLKLPNKLNYKPDNGDKIFRKDFIERCPCAKGFSHITLALLHECGHWATRSVMDMVEYDKFVGKVHNQKEYQKIPWEHLATDWAICWLSSPVNRKFAKMFEKMYFGY